MSNLLILFDGLIHDGSKVELYQFSRSPQEWLDRSKMIKGTYRIIPNDESYIDGMRVAWPKVNKPQDELPGRALVNIDPSATNVPYYPDSELLEYKFEPDSINAQKAATLYCQKKNGVKNRVSFTTSILALQNFDTLKPGDVITLFVYEEGSYNSPFDVIITNMQITKSCKVVISAVELHFMDEWDDINPDPITIVTDSNSGNMD